MFGKTFHVKRQPIFTFDYLEWFFVDCIRLKCLDKFKYTTMIDFYLRLKINTDFVICLDNIKMCRSYLNKFN